MNTEKPSFFQKHYILRAILISASVVISLILLGYSFTKLVPYYGASDSYSSLLTPPQPYFTSERPIHAVIISQKDTKGADLNRNNLYHASITLFSSLQKNQQALRDANPDFSGYDRIVVIFDPSFPVTDPDPFQEQAKYAFPLAKYSTVHPTAAQKETDIYPELSYHSTAGTLYIVQSYLNYTDFDPAILELQKAHYKDAFDNISKASLSTIDRKSTRLNSSH